MYGKILYQNSFYAKFISLVYASTQISVLYIGMYYNVTLGLPLTYIAAISAVIFFYDNFIKSVFGKLISKKHRLSNNKFYLFIFIILLYASLIFLFNADRFIYTETLFYYYFFAIIIYETFFTILNVYSDCWYVKSELREGIKKDINL